MKKVDIDAFGIDVPLAKQYNKIISVINKNPKELKFDKKYNCLEWEN